MGKLDAQVKEIKKYYFSGQLRKLLKRLIEYIIKNHYYSYMKTQKNNNRIYFIKAPRPYTGLNMFTDREITDALNRVLEISFTKAKSSDFVIHFYDKRADADSSYKKTYKVFNKKENFSNILIFAEKIK